MGLPLTLALTALFAGLAVFAGWRGARPPDPHRGPRLAPWRFIMLLATALAILMIVHLVNMAGVRTGR